MQSQEYPDLQFVKPKAYGSGRAGNAVQYIVVHYTAGSERSTSAEDGAAYDARRTDGTSTHYFVDSNSVVQCVYTWDRANAAFGIGNRKGIQYELCGTQQTRAQWLDAASDATLTNAARQMALDCIKYGLPVRWLTPAQMNAGFRGICGHADVTLAYGLGDHMDPGTAFPRDVLLQRIQSFMAAALPPAQQVRGGEEMLFFAKNPDGKGARWALVTGGYWVEYDAQDEGTNTALQSGKSYSEIADAAYRGLRQPFERADLVLDGTGPVV